MKPIRLTLDYVPSHKASRDFTLRLFEELTNEGIDCQLVVFGFERSILPKVKIIKHPSEITDEVVEFMNRRIEDKLLGPTFDNDIILDWNRRVREIRGVLFNEPEYFNIDLWECDGYFADIAFGKGRVESQLTITNAGGTRYYQYPIHNDRKEEEGYESIAEMLTRKEDSKPYDPDKSTTELVRLLREIQSKEIDIETLPEGKVITVELLEKSLRLK